MFYNKPFVQIIVWSDLWGNEFEVSVEKKADEDGKQFFKRTSLIATAHGWTPKKIWQFWRWNDTGVDFEGMYFYEDKSFYRNVIFFTVGFIIGLVLSQLFIHYFVR